MFSSELVPRGALGPARHDSHVPNSKRTFNKAPSLNGSNSAIWPLRICLGIRLCEKMSVIVRGLRECGVRWVEGFLTDDRSVWKLFCTGCLRFNL